MADLSDFLSIREETLETIIARMDADVNAGVGPDDDDFIDTTDGTFYADLRAAFALEIERLWDVATKDTVAACMVEFAWGDYLDVHGTAIGVERRDEVRATGEVTFTGTDGTLIGTGAEVSTVQVSEDDDPAAFVTTEAGTIAGGTLTLPVEAIEAGRTGNVAAGAIELVMSPIAGVTAVTNPTATTAGTDVEDDETYRERIKLAWSSARGGGSVDDYEAWSLDYPGVGDVRVTPLWLGAGTVRVTVTDVENNPVSDAILDGLQAQLDPFDALTLANGAQSGPLTTLTVDDTAEFPAAGRLIVGDQACSYTGKTSTTFTGITPSLASVADNAKVIQSGTGRGLAPVGAVVIVRTAENLIVDVDLELALDDGFTIDGAAGTRAVGPEVEALVREYIDGLPPGAQQGGGPDTGGGYVLLNRLVAAALRTPGVFDVTGLTINTVAADLAVAADQVPVTGTVSLTT